MYVSRCASLKATHLARLHTKTSLVQWRDRVQHITETCKNESASPTIVLASHPKLFTLPSVKTGRDGGAVMTPEEYVLAILSKIDQGKTMNCPSLTM